MALLDEIRSGNYYYPNPSTVNGGRSLTPTVTTPKRSVSNYIPTSMAVIERNYTINKAKELLAQGKTKKALTNWNSSPYLPAISVASSGSGTKTTAKKKTTKTPAASSSSSSSSSYRPYSYSSSGGSSYSSGSGGGGSAGQEYEQYGITKPWMDAYKEFWGSALPQKLWGMYEPVTSLFSRYMNRLPQMDDWQKIWQASQDYFAANEIDRKHMPIRLELYEPFIANMVRQPLFTPPDVSYSPGFSV